MNQAGQTPVSIYTIGYGSRTLSELIVIMRRFEVLYLVDVRSAPYSRYKPEFTQRALAASLRTAGLTYVFLGDTLGGRPDDPTLYSDGYIDYDKVRQTARYTEGIERLHTAFIQGQRTVLMCSEGKPEMCHRSKLIGATLTGLATLCSTLMKMTRPLLRMSSATAGKRDSFPSLAIGV